MNRLKSSTVVVLSLLLLQLTACSDKIIVPEGNSLTNYGKIAYSAFDYSGASASSQDAMVLDSNGDHPALLVANGYVSGSAAGRMIIGFFDTAVRVSVLTVANNDGANQIKVHYPDTLTPYVPGDISADGKHIAVPFKDSAGENLLFVTDLDGSNPRLITNKLAHESRVKFSNKGDKLAFYTSDRTGNAVSIYDVVHSTMITVARPQGLLPDGYERVSWSHDDGKIAYIVATSNGNEVHVVNADGWQEGTAGKGISAAWSPTADALAYDDENGGLHFLTDSGYVYTQPSPLEGLRVWDWTLDGRYVICESWSGDYDHSTVSIKLVNATTGEGRIVATPGIMPLVLR